jgi:Ca2+-binding RTX toxin-like protein
MRRTTTLTAAGLLGLALLAPTTAAQAAGETCRGEAATIVGAGYARIVGTEGRDVVVTNGSGDVETLAGDDLVCITGRDAGAGTQYGIDVDAGPGDDIVDGTAADSWSADVELGAGADRFEGGDADDDVNAGAVVVEGTQVLYPDTETDVLVGGGGDDSLRGGQVGAPNSDVLRGDAGRDSLDSRGDLTEAAVLDGGADVDRIAFDLAAGDHVLDNVAGRLLRGGAVVSRWTSVELFFLHDASTGGATLDIRGSDADESFLLSDGIRVTADLEGGNDVLSVPALLPEGSSVTGGDGRDHFGFGTADHAIEWDLRGDTVQVDDGRTIPASGFEDAFVSAPRVRLTGTDGPNDLSVNTCDGRLVGRNGPDTLDLISDYVFESFRSCAEKMVVLGGRGHDRIGSRAGAVERMVGGRGNDTFDAVGGDDRVFGGPGRDRALLGNGRDVFYGGPGRDRVDGQQDRDLCRAERERRCER